MSKKWIKGFDPVNCVYTPVFDTPLTDQPTFDTEEDCKVYCDKCNEESDKAWKSIEHKL